MLFLTNEAYLTSPTEGVIFLNEKWRKSTPDSWYCLKIKRAG